MRDGASDGRGGAVRPVDGQLQQATISISGSGRALGLLSRVQRGGRDQLGVRGTVAWFSRSRQGHSHVGDFSTATSSSLLARFRFRSGLFPVAVFRRDVIDRRRRGRLPAVGRLSITHDASASELRPDFR